MFDMQTVTSTDYGRLVGCCGSTWNEPPILQIDYETGATGNLNYMIGNDTGWNTVTSVTGDYNKHTYDLSITSFLRDGIQVATHSSDTFQCTSNLAIFYYLLSTGAPSDSNSYLKGRVYNFKIYENGTLVKDFIPVRAGSVGYLYDKVNDRLHGNRGADNFTIGSDI